MVEPKGRPKVLIRRHKIELPEDFLDDAKELLAIHETAGTVKAYVGTNVGAFAVTIAVVVGLLAFPPTQRLVAAFIGFIRMQIAAVAKDITSELIPSPQEVAGTIVEGAKTIAEEAQKALEEFNRRLRELREGRSGGDCPPGQHLELVTTPAGLVPQCVPDEPAL